MCTCLLSDAATDMTWLVASPCDQPTANPRPEGHFLLHLQVLDVPFEELEHLRHNGATLRAASKPHSRRKGDGEQGRKFTRDNKNRPMETSSKRPVPRLREVIAVPKRWISASILSMCV